jgi:hypothetical protein
MARLKEMTAVEKKENAPFSGLKDLLNKTNKKH